MIIRPSACAAETRIQCEDRIQCEEHRGRKHPHSVAARLSAASRPAPRPGVVSPHTGVTSRAATRETGDKWPAGVARGAVRDRLSGRGRAISGASGMSLDVFAC